jgi:hypothetical protein
MHPLTSKTLQDGLQRINQLRDNQQEEQAEAAEHVEEPDSEGF